MVFTENQIQIAFEARKQRLLIHLYPRAEYESMLRLLKKRKLIVPKTNRKIYHKQWRDRNREKIKISQKTYQKKKKRRLHEQKLNLYSIDQLKAALNLKLNSE